MGEDLKPRRKSKKIKSKFEKILKKFGIEDQGIEMDYAEIATMHQNCKD